jgi:hypothetical protein
MTQTRRNTRWFEEFMLWVSSLDTGEMGSVLQRLGESCHWDNRHSIPVYRISSCLNTDQYETITLLSFPASLRIVCCYLLLCAVPMLSCWRALKRRLLDRLHQTTRPRLKLPWCMPQGSTFFPINNSSSLAHSGIFSLARTAQ